MSFKVKKKTKNNNSFLKKLFCNCSPFSGPVTQTPARSENQGCLQRPCPGTVHSPSPHTCTQHLAQQLCTNLLITGCFSNEDFRFARLKQLAVEPHASAVNDCLKWLDGGLAKTYMNDYAATNAGYHHTCQLTYNCGGTSKQQHLVPTSP